MEEFETVLTLARTQDKPNFTQLQLRLMELNAPLHYYRELRKVMEERFKLTPLPEVTSKKISITNAYGSHSVAHNKGVINIY